MPFEGVALSPSILIKYIEPYYRAYNPLPPPSIPQPGPPLSGTLPLQLPAVRRSGGELEGEEETEEKEAPEEEEDHQDCSSDTDSVCSAINIIYC